MIIHTEDGVPPSNSRMVIIDETYTDDVDAGNSAVHTFTPPVGYLWKITSIYLKVTAPSGAASGTHQFMIANAVSAMMRGISVFGSGIEWDGSIWITADSAKIPSTEIAALFALTSAVFDSENTLNILYYNDTDVISTGARQIEIVIEETPKI